MSIVLISSMTGPYVLWLHTRTTKNLYAYLSNLSVLSLKLKCNLSSGFHFLLDIQSDFNCVELVSRVIRFSNSDHGGIIYWALIHLHVHRRMASENRIEM